MKFTTDITVDIHDVDYNGVARFSSLMRYVQSCAQSQLTSHGMSYDQLKSMKRGFILSRIRIEFTEPVRAYDRVRATSFPCHSKGFSFLRCYTLEKEDRLIGRAVSVWALIDTDTRSLVRVNDFDLGLETYDPHELMINRFTLPTEMKLGGIYTVRYSDLDQNKHMNNTRYPDMYAEFLPMDGKRIESLSINYQNEAPAGEHLSVFVADCAGGLYYIRTVREDGKTNTEAEILLKDI